MGSRHWTLSRAGIWVVAVCALATAAQGQEPRPAARGDAEFPALKVIEFDVVDVATNKPLAGVKLSGRVTNQRRQWTTGEDGHARVDVDGDARLLTILAEKDGYVPVSITWAPGQTREPLPGDYLLKLEKGTTIGGRVTDEAGQPIAGAEVALVLRRKGENRVIGGVETGERASLGSVRVKTDPDGRWQFDGAPARIEPPAVQVTHPDFVSDPGYTQRSALPEEKFRDRSVVLVMAKGVSVGGRVVDPEGKPVAGAQVTLGATRFGIGRVPSARSGEDGRFTFPNARPGQRATLVAKAKGWAPGSAEVQVEKSVEGVEVKLRPGRVVRVRVVNAKGDAIAGANVSAGLAGANTVNAWRATTGADGRVAWDEAPADEVRLLASARGHSTGVGRSAKGAGGEEELVITLTPLAKIVGKVVDDATGEPVEKFSATVAAPPRPGTIAIAFAGDSGSATYGPGGTFELAENARRRAAFAVRVEAAGYVPATSREIAGGEGDVSLEFRLKRGKDIVATLRAMDGRPLAGASALLVAEGSQVMIRNGKPTMQTFAAQAKADEAGRFRMGPQAGNYAVIVLHDLGYAELKAEQLAGENPEITVSPWASVRGTAWVGSKPAAGRTVTAMAEPRGPRGSSGPAARVDASAVVDEQGQFVLDRVPPGEIMLGMELVTRDDPMGRTVSWTPRQRLEAEAGKTAEVKVGGTGRPVVGKLVAPADVKADWTYASVRLASKPKVVQQMPADWATMSNEARRQWHEAWAKSPEGIAVMKEQRESRSYPAKVAADGTFRADDVEAGAYAVTVKLEQAPAAGGPRFAGRAVAATQVEVTVPEMTGGRSDEALDVGAVELKAATPGDGAGPRLRR